MFFTYRMAIWGFPGGSAGKESTCNVEDLGSIPGVGRSFGEGKGYTLQYSGLEESMDCSAWGHRVGQDWATFTSLQSDIWMTSHSFYSNDGFRKLML